MIFVALLGLYLSMHGYHSREGDQAYRLPLLLASQNPAQYADDPFVASFHAFNPHRGYLAVLDSATKVVGLSWGLFGLYALTFVLMAWGVDQLARVVWPECGARVGVLAVCLVLLAQAGNIGTNHLFEPILLDRLLALGLGWTAFALAVRGARCGRWLVAPLLGAAALIHPSLGLLLAALMVATWLSGALLIGGSKETSDCDAAAFPTRTETRFTLKQAIFGSIALFLCLIPSFALIARQSGRLFAGLSPEEFRLLEVYIQSPQHMVPHLWRTPQWLAAGSYLILALLAVVSSSRQWRWPPALRGLLSLLAVNVVCLVLAYVLIECLQNLRMTVFQPFRLATVCRGLCLILVSGRVISLWQAGDLISRCRAASLCAGLTGDWAFVVVTLAEVGATVAGWAWDGDGVDWANWLRRTRRRDSDALPPPLRGRAGAGGRVAASLRLSAHIEHRHNSFVEAVHGADQTAATFLDSALRPSSTLVPATQPSPARGEGFKTPRRGEGFKTPRARSVGRHVASVVWVVTFVLGCAYLARHDTQSGHWRLLGAALSVGALQARAGLRHRRMQVIDLGAPVPWNRRRALVAISSAWLIPSAAAIVQCQSPAGDSPTNAVARALVAHCRFAEVPIDDQERLAAWCKDHTPASARFIGPPGPKGFRYWSRRAVAFNRAASPYHATGLADWAHRFREHVAFTGTTEEFARAYLQDRQRLERRYDALGAQQLADLARRQEASYVVASPSVSSRERDPDSPLELLRVEGRYAVYSVPAPSTERLAKSVSGEPRR
jgi:hypothetical protein